MIKAVIEDGHGQGHTVRVSKEGAQYVIVHPHPPREEVDVLLPMRQYLTLDNDGTTRDMRVDGSVTEQIFSIGANPNGNQRDRYVASINFIIADAGATLAQFGNIGALTNGMTLRWVTDEFGTVTIGDELTSNWEFVRLSGINPAFGDGTSALRASNVVGASEAFLIQMDFDEVFGIQWGFRLRHGTNDRIELVIKDDVTGVDQFDAIAYGSEF